ncbi:phage head-tail adapter protein [Brevundimonas sp. S30B]|uniref:phage head completion protein n=1 Tax=unclassified Brevundimonas TaxID=2622653 RepID=UPI001071B449|nr:MULTISPECIES: head-tail adaptor protein [unclassified Brevundimonas]QBX37355.1 phage head-tail adapter protein [Brevundimonas sp. MF30-B]TFW03852.1 phage head-tail adapter protein [Brevundimonas sp. S30B]
MRVLARVLSPVETVTPYGGRATTYEPAGMVWLALGVRRRRTRTEAGAARATETLSAGTRADPRLAVGQVLRFGGADWTLDCLAPDAARPGRLKLELERRR